VLLNMTRFDMSPDEAVAAPRFHHQWLPEELLLEDGLAAPIREEMKRLGHHVVVRGSLAAAQAAARSDEGVTGGSDPRKGGKPAGY
jgi:gamma-glutamyltranspeptidase/glutathione hydrolase